MRLRLEISRIAAATRGASGVPIGLNVTSIGISEIRGQTGAPKAIPSVDLLRKVVAAMAGALTYLDAADITPDLKVVSIEGKLPTDLDYPLKLQ